MDYDRWRSNLELLGRLFPNLDLNEDEARIWTKEFGPGSRRGNQEWLKEAVELEYTREAAGRPMIVRIRQAFDEVKAENTYRQPKSPEADDLRNAVLVPRQCGQPPLRYCESAWASASPYAAQCRTALRELGVTTAVALQSVFDDDDEWGWTYSDIMPHALAKLDPESWDPARRVHHTLRMAAEMPRTAFVAVEATTGSFADETP